MAPLIVSAPWCASYVYDGPRCACNIVDDAMERLGARLAGAGLVVHGRRLCGSSLVPDSATVAEVTLPGLRGGKGGFGAMLRAMGKAAGAKTTTNFGACRDLYGRRLRHVNDELRMQKWTEYQEAKREAEARNDKEALARLVHPEQDTASGIHGWHLAVPKWADGVDKLGKANKKRMMRRMRRKAHEAGGRDDGARAAPRTVQGGHKFTTLTREDYVAGAAAPATDEAVADAVRVGLQAESAAKRRRVQEEEARAGKLMPVEDGGVSGVPALHWDDTACLLAMVGDLVVQEGAVLEGLSEFGSARVSDVALAAGRWYYEVKVLSDGLMQIGWADAAFAAQDPTDGVGDHPRSWAYDGVRQRRWNGEAEGVQYGSSWSRGAVVGCLLDADAGTMTFTLNGEDLGVAYTGVDCAANGGLFPALSLEQGESAAVNLGQRPFSYPPSRQRGYRSVWSHPALEGRAMDVALAGADASAGGAQDGPAGAAGSAQGVMEEEEEEEEEGQREQEEEEEEGRERGEPGLEPEPKPEPKPVDLTGFADAEALRALGLEALKRELARRGAKCGGSLEERAERLHRVRDLGTEGDLPPDLRAGTKRKGKKKRGRTGNV